MKKVAVIMGSDSDFPVVSKAVAELKAYGVPYECHVMSAHRTPALASDFADKAKNGGSSCRSYCRSHNASCYRYPLQGC